MDIAALLTDCDDDHHFADARGVRFYSVSEVDRLSLEDWDFANDQGETDSSDLFVSENGDGEHDGSSVSGSSLRFGSSDFGYASTDENEHEGSVDGLPYLGNGELEFLWDVDADLSYPDLHEEDDIDELFELGHFATLFRLDRAPRQPSPRHRPDLANQRVDFVAEESLRQRMRGPEHRGPNNHSSHLVQLARDDLVAFEVGLWRQERAQGRAEMAARQRPEAEQRRLSVIDLTQDSSDSENLIALDSFRRPHLSTTAAPQVRHHPVLNNPRRSQGLQARTPSFTRSDSSFLSGNNFVDLTGNGEGAMANQARSSRPFRGAAANPAPAPRLNGTRGNQHDRLSDRNDAVINVDDDDDDDDVIISDPSRLQAGRRGVLPSRNGGLNPPPAAAGGNIFTRTIAGIFGAHHIHVRRNLFDRDPNPLAQNMPNLDYGFGVRAPSPPYPQHVPPPPARAGFSRDANEDDVFVCPSCGEELKYDPNECEGNGPPIKRMRSRKDREEHHFWAVKECGHVYCQSCFASRTFKKSSSNGAEGNASFRTHGKKTFCAVVDCHSDVTSKLNWVGIFM